MTNDELNKAKAFLNKKELPSQEDILNLFFLENEEDNSFEATEPHDIDYELLGDADDIRTEKGSEWIITRLLWNTSEGYISRINLIKIGSEPLEDVNSLEFIPFIVPEETVDVELVPVDPLSFKDLLDEAVEEENFEEAVRLRDWDKDLKKLLFKLKPKIVKALKEEDVKSLDELLTQIRVYRSTL